MTATSARQIDVLVAQYASLGASKRQIVTERKRRRAGVVAGAAVLLGVIAAVVWVVWPLAWLTPPSPASWQIAKLTELSNQVTTELKLLSGERQQLEQQRAYFEAQAAELTAQMQYLEREQVAWATQRAEVSSQTSQLQQAIAEMERERQTLAAARVTSPSLEREIETLVAERAALEQRWQQFASEGNRLSNDLGALRQERDRLQQQQAEMEQQRRELEALLKTADTEARQADPIAEAKQEALPQPEIDSLLAYSQPMVTDGELAQMRGGVMFGEGMEISIGLTRTASVNGVQQIANTLQLDKLTADLDPAAMSELNSLVIQSGPGNSIDPAVADALSPGYATIIQNTLDNQIINTTSIYNISVQDVSSAIQGLSATRAIADSLSLQN